MYFLGLASPSEVTPIAFVQNGVTSQITIDEIVAANGVRTPAYANGQTRVFRVPTFVVKRSGDTVSDAQLQKLQNVLFRWQSRFYRETGGRAHANLTLDGTCSYTLSASSIRPAAVAATGSISVIADPGCAWTATTTDSFITVTSGASGTANGTLSYAIAANANANKSHRHDHHRRSAVHCDSAGSSAAAGGGEVTTARPPHPPSAPSPPKSRRRRALDEKVARRLPGLESRLRGRIETCI
jgi:hypothetical protein